MTQRPDDKEWDEFQLWLQFKRERSQETTVVVTCEQPELLIEQEELVPKPVRAGLWYTPLEVELLQELHGAKVHVKRIAYLMQRDVEGIKRKLRKLRSGDYS